MTEIQPMRRVCALFAGALVFVLCSCMQPQHADPGSSFHQGLQREAWRTMSAFNDAVIAHYATMSTVIPQPYWDPGIEQLRPVKVYVHRGNLVVVQRESHGVERGKYIELPVAPFHPVQAWFSNKHAVDGFVFRPARGAGVSNFVRTTPY